jgi:hypothetical protein
MAAGRGFTGADAATARLRTKDLRRLWCKFTPPVNIIFPVWNSSRWRTEFDKSIADRGEEAGRSVFPALGFPQKTALADWLVGLGPLVATGDMYALQYFLFMLTSMHGLKGIRLHEAWSLSGGLPSLAKPIGASSDLDEVLGQNIVIVGGPAGNPVAQSLLDVLNATSLFPDAPRSDFRIRKWGIPRSDKDAFLAPKIGTSKDQSDEDCGLLLVGRNPWSRDRSKWFMAAMGSASWGTQACAALACSDAGATELARSRVGQDPEIVDAGWVGEIGYVKVWPKLSVGSKRSDRLPDLTVPDSNFQMVFPYEGKLHSNPLAILSAGEMLRTAHKGPTNMEIGFRPAILLVAICCLCIASAIAAFGALSSQPWGPITCAVCLAAAGVSLVPRSLRVGQSAAKLSATPANPPPQ